METEPDIADSILKALLSLDWSDPKTYGVASVILLVGYIARCQWPKREKK